MGVRGSLSPLSIINVHVPAYVLFLEEKVFGSYQILKGFCDQKVIRKHCSKCKSISSWQSLFSGE